MLIPTMARIRKTKKKKNASANESSERESWVGRLVGQGSSSTNTQIHVQDRVYKSIEEPVRDADYPGPTDRPPSIFFFFFGRRSSSSFLILILSRDDIDIEIENIDRQKKRKKKREEEEEKKITH